MTQTTQKRYTIHNGNCLEVMATLPENSVDTIITDPPYGLKLMGKNWDKGVPGIPFWVEALRVAKPGAMLMAFGGTRMVHRLACAIEDAGWIIRDQISWVYGCLPVEAEVLTSKGWKSGSEIEIGDIVAQWNPENEAITLAPCNQVTRAPYSGTMRVLENDDTVQMLTPNHRVFHKTMVRDLGPDPRRFHTPDDWSVTEAEKVTRWKPTWLPLSGEADGPGIGGDDYASMLGWIWSEGHFDGKPSTGVRIYQSPSANPEHTDEIGSLMLRVVPKAKIYNRDRDYHGKNGLVISSERTWFFTGPMAKQVRKDLPGKMITFDLIWKMSLSEKRAFIDAAYKGDGSGDSIEQKGVFQLEMLQVLYHLVGWSARVTMRKNRSTGSCHFRRSNKTQVQSKHFKVSPDRHYEGIVWCVSVPTGAFVARYKNRIFVTGNSGFPKSHNLAKHFDKAAGIQPIGEKPASLGMANNDQWNTLNRQLVMPELQTEDAKEWDGYGTALKPAQEPVVVAMKPLDGTYIENAKKWGVAGLWIDGAMIGDEVVTINTFDDGAKPFGGGAGHEFTPRKSKGRWPANLAFDEDAAKILDDQEKEASRFFFVAKPNKSERNRGLSGEEKQETGGGGLNHEELGRKYGSIKGKHKNHHPTVKPVAFMAWLARLTATPSKGVVLDPFMGSGTTGVAAILEGRNFIGIDLDPEYCAIAEGRIQHAESYKIDEEDCPIGVTVAEHRIGQMGLFDIEPEEKEEKPPKAKKYTKGKRTREYNSYSHMVRRCTDPNDAAYPSYGGRGITVDDRWLGNDGFDYFMLDMGPRPENTSLDKEKNDEGYGPDNCRWATPKEQANNRRSPGTAYLTNGN